MSQRRTDTTFGNSVVARRELIQKQQGHRQRINGIKSTLDTRAPAPQPHLTLYGRDYVAKKKATTEAAFSDLKMIQSIARTMTRKREETERKGPISLNADARKQEIYNIMHANHKLLESIENVTPVMRAKDVIRDHRDKLRYVINSSHTMRLSGEYDLEIDRIHKEDRTRFETLQRSTRMRMDASQRMKSSSGGSVSLPSLTTSTRSNPDRSTVPASRGRAAASGGASSAGILPTGTDAVPPRPSAGSCQPGARRRSQPPGGADRSQEPEITPDESPAEAPVRHSVSFSGAADEPASQHRKRGSMRRASTPHPSQPGSDAEWDADADTSRAAKDGSESGEELADENSTELVHRGRPSSSGAQESAAGRAEGQLAEDAQTASRVEPGIGDLRDSPDRMEQRSKGDLDKPSTRGGHADEEAGRQPSHETPREGTEEQSADPKTPVSRKGDGGPQHVIEGGPVPEEVEEVGGEATGDPPGQHSGAGVEPAAPEEVQSGGHQASVPALATSTPDLASTGMAPEASGSREAGYHEAYEDTFEDDFESSPRTTPSAVKAEATVGRPSSEWQDEERTGSGITAQRGGQSANAPYPAKQEPGLEEYYEDDYEED